MKITEVKAYMNKQVRYVSRKLNIDQQYILSACILRRNCKGEYYYLAEIMDIKQKMSVLIVPLEEIHGETDCGTKMDGGDGNGTINGKN